MPHCMPTFGILGKPDEGFITLNIDLKQMGVGGNTSWDDLAQPLEKYQIPAKPYSYSFYLVPVKNAKGQ